MAVFDVLLYLKKEEIKEKKMKNFFKKLALNYHNSLYNEASSFVYNSSNFRKCEVALKH